MTMVRPDSSVGYVELYVVDAVPALEYFTGALTFTARALAEQPDRYSVLLASGAARLVVTEPRGGGAVAEWLDVHGDGVRDVALCCRDLDGVIERARRAGLPVMLGPGLDAATGTRHARVGGVGSLCHTLLGVGSDGDMPPGLDWRPLRTIAEPAPPAVESIDHFAVCLPAGTLAETVATYRSVFDMRIIGSEPVEMGNTAMNSFVLRDVAGLTFVMREPDPACLRDDQFLEAHQAAGVQCVAFRSDDVVAARDRDHDGVLNQLFTSYRHEPDGLHFAGRISHKLRGGRCHVRSDQRICGGCHGR